MKTLDFFRRVLPSEGHYCIAVPMGNGKGFKQKFFTALEDAADMAHLLSERGVDVYYAVSSFKEPGSRKGVNALYTKLLALDIDVGKEANSYDTRKEALTAAVSFVDNTGLPRPTIVSSGAGFHVYWTLTEQLPPERWLPLAEALKKRALDSGLIIDPAVPADRARVLRPVGTVHVKSGRSVTAITEGEDVDPVVLGGLLNVSQMAPSGFRKHRTTNLLDNLSTKPELPKGNPAVIVGKCKQIAWAVSHQDEVQEPLWYSVLGVAAFTENAEETAVEWSKGHPNFDYGTTIRKLEQWKNNASGPSTCSRFESARPGGCKGCPFAGKVNTPVRLGAQFEEVAPPEEAPHDTAVVVPMPYPFKRTAAGIKITIDDTDFDICPFDLYPVGYGKDETLGYEVVRYNWNRPHVGWTELKLRQAYLTDGSREFAGACADQGIVLGTKRHTELFQQMLRSYMDELRKMKTLTNLYATMGWKNNFEEFVLGDTIIRNDGGKVVEEQATLATSIHKTGTDLYSTGGSKDEWIASTSLLQKAGMPWHIFALGLGFAAPLFAFTGLKGMTVSLYGPTGGGKTLIQYWIQSIYGNPDRLHFAAKYTQNSLFGRLGVYAHLPMTIDEATIMLDKDVGEFLYWVSQGRDKARLTRSAEEKDAKTWATPVILSTNKSIQSKLMASGLDTDAQMARLLEVNVPEHKLFGRDSTAGGALYRHLMTNYGHVGRDYIRHLVGLGPEGVQKLLDKARQEFAKQYDVKFAGAERFWEQAIILQDLGSRIAHELGLIQYDYTMGTRWVIEQLRGVRKSVSENKVDAYDILGDYLNDVADAAVTVMHIASQRPVPDMQKLPRGEIRARFDVYKPTAAASFDKGTLLIDRTHFRKWLAAQGGDYKGFVSEMEASGVLATPRSKKAYLGKDTSTKLGQVYVIGFDLAHPRLCGILNDADDALEKAASSKLRLVSSRGEEQSE